MDADQFNRLGEMLQSIKPDLDLDTHEGRNEVLRAQAGQIWPPPEMDAVCCCGWRGKVMRLRQVVYESDKLAWERKAGKLGKLYKCPRCDETVWQHDWIVS